MRKVDAPIESAHVFGRDRNLVGTVTLPATVGAAPRLGVVLLNAGVIGRAGPHRMNVRIARALAEVGIPSLRFDLAGLGDSKRASTPLPYEQQAVDDLRQAMDHLGFAAGVQRFGIVGFCSGADHGYAAALQDPRLRELYLFDPFPHPTRLTHLIRVATRVREMGLGGLAQKVWGRLGGWKPARGGAVAVGRPSSSRPTPDRATYAQALGGLLRDGARIKMLYSGSGLYGYNHASQFHRGFAAWPELRAISVDYLPIIDHTLSDVRMQAHFVELVRTWFNSPR